MVLSETPTAFARSTYGCLLFSLSADKIARSVSSTPAIGAPFRFPVKNPATPEKDKKNIFFSKKR